MAGRKYKTLDEVIERVKLLRSDLAEQALGVIGTKLYVLARGSIERQQNPRGRAWTPFKVPDPQMPSRALGALRKEILSNVVYLDVQMPSAKAQQGGARHLGYHNGKKLTSASIRLLSAEQSKGITRDSWRLPARNMLPGRGGSGGSITGNMKLPPRWHDAIVQSLRVQFGRIAGKIE